MTLEDALREAADTFTMTVAVVADETGRSTYEVAYEALGDSLARLKESGALGMPERDEE